MPFRWSLPQDIALLSKRCCGAETNAITVIQSQAAFQCCPLETALQLASYWPT